MVAKRAGQAAGGFAGGLFNNPGVVAIVGIVAAIGIGLAFFAGDIRKAFAGLSEGIGDINIQLPEIQFPTFEFPEITFPEFPSFPEFPMFPSFEDIFGQPPPMPGEIIDGELVPGEIPGDGLGPVEIPEGCTVGPDGVVSCPTPPTFDASLFVTEEELAARLGPQVLEEDIPAPLFTGLEGVEITGGGAVFADPISEPFAVTNIEETQAEFQERSAAFAEAFPAITESTSLPGGEIIFGEQLARESEDFQSALEAEAARSESIFAALFGNVQNPEFGA